MIGYHGCSKETADRIINEGSKLDKSENSYDWLGHGIYFWEFNFERAWQWASEKKGLKDPYVIGAYIDLKNCLDLVSSDGLKLLKPCYETLGKLCKANSIKMPKNTTVRRDLDCKVIEMFKSMMGTKQKINSVRGVFWEGEELYKGSFFRERNHIQISVEQSCIVGFFRPEEMKG